MKLEFALLLMTCISTISGKVCSSKNATYHKPEFRTCLDNQMCCGEFNNECCNHDNGDFVHSVNKLLGYQYFQNMLLGLFVLMLVLSVLMLVMAISIAREGRQRPQPEHGLPVPKTESDPTSPVLSQRANAVIPFKEQKPSKHKNSFSNPAFTLNAETLRPTIP